MAKAGYVSIDGTTRKVKSIYISVNGVARKVKAAYVGVNGVARQWYQSGLPASSLSVGSSVYLNEGGSYVEYLVVNQGKPSGSSLYDDSCDGTWLLRKDIHSIRVWNSTGKNVYETSDINTWLNGDFFSSMGATEQAVIKQVKIPYRSGGGSGGTDQSGANGLSCKVFLLSGYEVGWTRATSGNSNNRALPIEGACLSYFSGTASIDSKRIGYLSGSAAHWWLRSPNTGNTINVWYVSAEGGGYYNTASRSYGIRPALILPFTATFDPTTMRLIG